MPAYIIYSVLQFPQQCLAAYPVGSLPGRIKPISVCPPLTDIGDWEFCCCGLLFVVWSSFRRILLSEWNIGLDLVSWYLSEAAL